MPLPVFFKFRHRVYTAEGEQVLHIGGFHGLCRLVVAGAVNHAVNRSGKFPLKPYNRHAGQSYRLMQVFGKGVRGVDDALYAVGGAEIL